MEAGVIQAIGFLGMLGIISSFQFKHRRTIIAVQTFGSLMFGLHFLLLGFATAAVMNVVAASRNVLFMKYSQSKRPLWPLIVVLSASVALPLLTWGGWVSVLPMIALVTSTIGMWQRDEQKIRLWTLGSPPSWILHNIITGSIPGIINETIAYTSIVVSYLRYRRKAGNVRK